MQIINQRKTRDSHLITNPKVSKDANSLKKEVVLFIIRRCLLETGIESFELVTRSLFEKYRCELSDSFENPEYLVDVLRYVYDSSYATIVKSIRQHLCKFADDITIEKFLEKLC